jgi:hypothetical protein
VIDSTLPAASIPFADDFDAETSAWSTEAEWGRVEEKGRGKVFTDTPHGDYKDSVDNGIISPSFDLSTMRSSVVSFEAKMKTEKWDFLWVEARHGDSDRFEHVGIVRPDENRDWQKFQMDLSGFDGKKDVQLKFKLRTSRKGTDDGVYLDNVKVESAKV